MITVTGYQPHPFLSFLMETFRVPALSILIKEPRIKILLMFKDKFMKHCDWEETKWIARMSGEEFEKKCECEKGRSNVELSEDTNCEL